MPHPESDLLWLTRSHNFVIPPSTVELAQIQAQILEKFNSEYRGVSGGVEKRKLERDRRFDIQDMVAELNKRKFVPTLPK